MFENLLEMWRNAARGARAGLMAGAVLIAALVVYFSAVVLRVDYQTLFSDLNPQDAATMVAELDRLKVAYRLSADGTTIQVDRAQVHATRLKLLGKTGGALQGGVGFEIFNNTDFGMTEFAQKINYQRALQGEITRTIQALDEVRSARVHLVLPESGLFRKSGLKPKASITLAMKEGRTLAPEQVLGIQRLVAAAVPEIEPGAVTIADHHGVTLTRASAAGEGEEAMSGRLGTKSEIEAYFARKLVALFDKAFGPGRVIVSVDVSINHDQVKVTREDVVPLGMRGGDAVGAMTRSRTTVQGDAGAAGGVPGAPAEATKGGSSTSEVEFLNGRRIEQVVSMPGSIKRLSVGVVLPAITDKSRVEEIRQLVATTVGMNPARGDEIAISAIDLSAGAPRAGVADGATAGATGAAAGSMNTPAEVPKVTAVPASAPQRLAAGAQGAGAVVQGLVLALVAALLLALGVMVSRRRRPKPLSPQAREAVLARVQTWLREDGVRP